MCTNTTYFKPRTPKHQKHSTLNNRAQTQYRPALYVRHNKYYYRCNSELCSHGRNTQLAYMYMEQALENGCSGSILLLVKYFKKGRVNLRKVGLVTYSLSNALLRPKRHRPHSRTFGLVSRLRHHNVIFVPTDNHRCTDLHCLFTPITSRLTCMYRGKTLIVDRKHTIIGHSVRHDLTVSVTGTIITCPRTSIALSYRKRLCAVDNGSTFISRLHCRIRYSITIISHPRSVSRSIVGVTFRAPRISRPTTLRCFRHLFDSHISIVASKAR